MCAAPGGKATHVAALMRDTGQIIALDKSKKKIQTLQQTINVLGLTCITPKNLDAAKAASTFPAESFDRIVLDPPCSGASFALGGSSISLFWVVLFLGLGNRPRFLEPMSAATLSGHADYQRRIFTQAMALLKPGGYLVYSTCTINPEENEETVQWALDNFPQRLELIEPEKHLKFGLPGLHTTNLREEFAGYWHLFDFVRNW